MGVNGFIFLLIATVFSKKKYPKESENTIEVEAA